MPGPGSRDLRERAKHAQHLALSTWDELARDALDKYADRWEAILGGRVVGTVPSGHSKPVTPLAARSLAPPVLLAASRIREVRVLEFRLAFSRPPIAGLRLAP